MCMPLPIGDYTKVHLHTEEKFQKPGSQIDEVKRILKRYGDNDRRGYMIEVIFEIPDHLHDVFDYAPVVKRVVEHDDLSERQHLIGETFGACTATPKLIPFLGKHTKVLYHTGLLKFWVESS